jgi:hypothetical protein
MQKRSMFTIGLLLGNSLIHKGIRSQPHGGKQYIFKTQNVVASAHFVQREAREICGQLP